MNKYELVLQIFAIVFLLFILYLLFRFVVASIRAKRLTDFSLRGSKESSEKSIIFRIIYSFSDNVFTMPASVLFPDSKEDNTCCIGD